VLGDSVGVVIDSSAGEVLLLMFASSRDPVASCVSLISKIRNQALAQTFAACRLFRCGGADGSAMSDCFAAWLEGQRGRQGVASRGVSAGIHTSPDMEVRTGHARDSRTGMFASKVHAV
jgi:hypothetical protein